jgi:hypothetical protein
VFDVVGISKRELKKFKHKYTVYRKDIGGRPPILSPADEVLLFLLWLRHYPVDMLLAVIFAISESTVRSVRQRLLHWFYTEHKTELTLHTPKWRKDRGIVFMNHMYTFIVDGTEQPCAGSADPLRDFEFFSSKKSQHSLNILLVTALDGTILYVSPSFGGSRIDLLVAKATLQDWFMKFEEDEYGLADSGFQGLNRCRVFTPPPNRSDPLWKMHAHFRAIIKQRNADMKDFRATHDAWRAPVQRKEELLVEHHKVWVVVAVFVNKYRPRCLPTRSLHE